MSYTVEKIDKDEHSIRFKLIDPDPIFKVVLRFDDIDDGRQLYIALYKFHTFLGKNFLSCKLGSQSLHHIREYDHVIKALRRFINGHNKFKDIRVEEYHYRLCTPAWKEVMENCEEWEQADSVVEARTIKSALETVANAIFL